MGYFFLKIKGKRKDINWKHHLKMNPSSCFCSLLGAPWHFAAHDAWPHPPQPPHPVPPHPAARTPWRLAPRERTPWRPWLGRSRSRWHRGWEGRRRDPLAESPLDPFFSPRETFGLFVLFLGQTFQVKCFGWWKYRWSFKRKGKHTGWTTKIKKWIPLASKKWVCSLWPYHSG